MKENTSSNLFYNSSIVEDWLVVWEGDGSGEESKEQGSFQQGLYNLKIADYAGGMN